VPVCPRAENSIKNACVQQRAKRIRAQLFTAIFSANSFCFPPFATTEVQPTMPGCPIQERKGDAMQNGSITRSTRSHGPDVWEFRWREAGSDGKRKHRRMVIGSIAQFSDKSSALLEVTALRRQINLHDPRLSLQPVTVSELVNHYRQRKLATDQTWKTYSTKVTYRGLPKQHGFCRAGKTMLFPQSMQARWSYGSDPCPWHGQPAPRSEIS
jgi:hypothetical protein